MDTVAARALVEAQEGKYGYPFSILNAFVQKFCKLGTGVISYFRKDPFSIPSVGSSPKALPRLGSQIPCK
jgi:hypothetical protein